MNEARPRTVTALAAALQGVGGGLGWSLLPPLMPTLAAELHLSHVLLMLVGQAGGFLLPVLTGVATQHAGFSGALAFLAVIHGLIWVPALRFTETGSKRASSVSTLQPVQST